MDLYAHYSIARSGSNSLFHAIVNSMANVKGTQIKEMVRFNRYRKEIIYNNAYFAKVRFNPEITFLEMGLPKKVILSLRKDKVRQAISFFLVQKGGLSTTIKTIIPEEDLHRIQNEVLIDENEFFTYMQDKIERIKRKEKKLSKYFEENNIQIKIIWYEDLFADYENTVKDCIKFLFDVDYKNSIEFYTFKASSEVNDRLYNLYMKKLKLQQVMSRLK